MKARLELISALAILLVTILLIIITYGRYFPLNFALGPFRFTHWLSWIGTSFVAVLTPVFYVLRRRYRERNIALTRIHVYGSLLSFALVSVHFAQQMSRSVHPEDNTGTAMYIIFSILLASGFLQKFSILGKNRLYPPHRNRFLHVGTVTSFYIIIIIHILHNLGLFPL